MMDLFFEPDYGKLYEEVENGVCEVYEFNHELGTVKHLFIKREVPLRIHGKKYYDLVTPYGYGGPLITAVQEGRKTELAAAFTKAFQQYCDVHHIVSEFIRFHPVLGNACEFKDSYDVVFLRKTVGTNLRDYDDPVQEEFSKSTRKAIRHALRTGVEYRVTVNPESLDLFSEIYRINMERVQADSYYYFDKSYFSRCLEYFGEHIVLVEAVFEGKVIGAEMHFAYNNLIHTHLSGTLSEYHYLSPVYVMTYAIAMWGKENGMDLIHVGGGTTNEPDDTLYLFKKKFGKNTDFDFYIGRRVWNEAVYAELCAASEVGPEEGFFPAYRGKSARNFSKV
ncbi:GNAT family N-acetyltransferase [Planococcus chinensis]|uniref:Lipid II:glycine glycyltransferase n=1 Tax=Planococcus chinensis TaxID=272917 RepID=A0ABW4QET6_9BACL